MSDIAIYIPTYRRGVERQHTWRYIPPEWRDAACFVVRPEEAEVFAWRFGARHVRVLPRHAPDGKPMMIPQTRQWILDNATADYIIMLDDDLTFQFRLKEGSHQLSAVDPATTEGENLMDWLFETLRYWMRGDGFAHVGVSARPGNNWCPADHKDGGRVYAAMGFNAGVLRHLGCRFDRVVMEDFDMTLQLFAHGMPNRVLYRAAHSQYPNVDGGCSTYRTHESHAAAAYELAAAWPEFVKAEQREGKWRGNEFQDGRVDVRVQWQRALKAGTAAVATRMP